MNTLSCNDLSRFDYIEAVINDRLLIPQAPDILRALCEIDSESKDVIDDLEKIIESNPILKRRFIKLANSALFRGVVSVNKIKTAIIRLGVTRVLSLLVGLTLSQYMQDRELEYVEKVFRQHWDFACHVACIAYVISERKQISTPEKAMISGLLHNIGFLSILLALQKVPFLVKEPRLMSSVISEVMPILTPFASKVTLEHWEISSEIASSIRGLEAVINEPGNHELTLLLKLAIKLCSSVECGALNENALNQEYKQLIYRFWPSIETARDELAQYHPTILQLKEILLS